MHISGISRIFVGIRRLGIHLAAFGSVFKGFYLSYVCKAKLPQPKLLSRDALTEE